MKFFHVTKNSFGRMPEKRSVSVMKEEKHVLIENRRTASVPMDLARRSHHET